ncbi:hypothetical protein N9L68_04175 [bacterium]|nr:hypothetical protein [bacterium]
MALSFQNISYLTEEAKDHLTQKQQAVDIAMIAEHRQRGDKLEKAQMDLKIGGWKARLQQASATEATGPLATSGGVGILHKPYVHVTPMERLLDTAERATWEHPRFLALVIHLKQYAFLLVVIYLETSTGFGPEDMGVLVALGGLIRALQLPYLVVGDLNAPPADLLATGWPQSLDGHVVPPSNVSYTSTAGDGNLLDYGVVHKDLRQMPASLLADWNVAWVPHCRLALEMTSNLDDVWLRVAVPTLTWIGGRAAEEKSARRSPTEVTDAASPGSVSDLTRPRLIRWGEASERAQGILKVRAQQWSTLACTALHRHLLPSAQALGQRLLEWAATTMVQQYIKLEGTDEQVRKAPLLPGDVPRFEWKTMRDLQRLKPLAAGKSLHSHSAYWMKVAAQCAAGRCASGTERIRVAYSLQAYAQSATEHLPDTDLAQVRAATWKARLEDPREAARLEDVQWDSWRAEASAQGKEAHAQAMLRGREEFKEWVARSIEKGARLGHRFTKSEEYAPPIEVVDLDGQYLTTPPEVMSWRRAHWKGIWGEAPQAELLDLYLELCRLEKEHR